MSAVYLVFVRRVLTTNDVYKNNGGHATTQQQQQQQGNNNNNNNAVANVIVEDDKFPHYWSAHLHVSDNDQPPAPWLYIDDQSTGMTRHLGFISSHEGINKFYPKRVGRAQLSLSGKHNYLNPNTDKDYRNLVCLLPSVDIFLM
jgi:hypothetical protein